MRATVKSGIIQSETNYEEACTDIRDIVAAFRRTGAKTIAGIYEAARLTGVYERRVRMLFFRERYTPVFEEERRRIRQGAIRGHRELAAKHRIMAAECDAIADAKEAATRFGDM